MGSPGDAKPPNLNARDFQDSLILWYGKRLKGLALSLVFALGGATLAATLLSIFAYGRWEFDLFSHFRLQYLACLLFCCIFSLSKGTRKYLPIWLCAIALNLAELAPYYVPQERAAAKVVIRLLQINLQFCNSRYDLISARIREANADLIAFEELTPDLDKYLSKNLPEYPYRLKDVQEGCFGVGVYSRLPLKKENIFVFPDQANYVAMPGVAMVQIEKSKQCFNIAVLHAMPPLSGYYIDSNKSLFAGLSTILQRQQAPFLVIGDFNLTRHSAVFLNFLRESGLKDSQLGFGWQSSWPATYPYLLRIPIDNCLCSPDLVCTKREVLGPCGSDHLPVLFEFGLAARN